MSEKENSVNVAKPIRLDGQITTWVNRKNDDEQPDGLIARLSIEVSNELDNRSFDLIGDVVSKAADELDKIIGAKYRVN